MWAHLRARHPLENDQAIAAQKEQGRKKAEAARERQRRGPGSGIYSLEAMGITSTGKL